jgi:hypothetical protein
MRDLVLLLRNHPLTRGLTVEDRRVQPVRGGFEPVGVILHHTVSSPPTDLPSLNVCRVGRPDLAGPLCQLLIGRTGRIVVITDGRANHAGKGDGTVLTRMRADISPRPRPGPDTIGSNGNHFLYGIEAENNGTGEPWSPELLDSFWRTAAALCDSFRWDPRYRVIGHAEWSRRKIDPRFETPVMSMNDARGHIYALITHDHDPHPDHGDDDDMPRYTEWDPMDKLALRADIHETIVPRVTGSQGAGVNGPVTNLGDVVNLINALTSKVDALAKKVDAISR